MEKRNETQDNGPRLCRVFILLSVILIIIYANSFKGQWQFDDLPNLVNNPNIALESFSINDIVDAVSVDSPSGRRIDRPVSRITFALNHLVSGFDPFSYHLVNFLIHLAASFLLYLVLYSTLNLPLLKQDYGLISHDIALLATALWATSPVNTAAVTYIVQRMASMATLFYILAIYFYILARFEKRLFLRRLFYSGCFIAFLLSVGSKEIGLTLLAVLFFFETILIRPRGAIDTKKMFLLLLGLILFFGFAAVTILIPRLGEALGYTDWSFTLAERLMTEPRVIIRYIGLLIYPLSSRLCMDYDVTLSRSLLEPWTTLPALLGVAVAIILAFVFKKKKPLFSFCVLFFLLNHVMEGSLVALDLMFDHRNYLPSTFFFILPAVFLIKARSFFYKNRLLRHGISFLIILVLISQGHVVFLRNRLFSNPLDLWLDNTVKMPGLSRPYAAVGRILMKEGRFDEGAFFIKNAIKKGNYPNKRQVAVYYTLLADYYFTRKDDANKAEELISKAFEKGVPITEAYALLGRIMLKKGDFEKARENLERAIALRPGQAAYVNDLALVMLKKNMPHKAVGLTLKAMALSGSLSSPLAICAGAYMSMGRPETATGLWEAYLKREPEDVNAVLALIELYGDNGRDGDRLAALVCRLLDITGGDWKKPLNTPEELKNFLAYNPDVEKTERVVTRVIAGLQ